MGKFLYFIFFLYLLTNLKSFEAVNLACGFSTASFFSTVGSVYECGVSTYLNIKSPENAVIDNVSGTHLKSKYNSDVIAFRADNNVIEYFPKGLEKFFKNIKVIFIYNSGLKEISQSDLKSFPNLVYLCLNNNAIEFLADGLFSNHPSMTAVYFSSNNIFHVGKNVFSNMNKITYLVFGSNPCISMEARGEASQAKLIIESIKTKCFDANFSNISKNLANLENESKTLNFYNIQAWSEELKNLEMEFKSSKFSNVAIIKEKFQVLNAIKITEFPELLIFKFDLEDSFKKMFTDALNQTEQNFKNLENESCTEVNYQTLNLMKDEFFKVNEKFLEHSSEVRSELIKNDVQHSAILSEISNLKKKLDILEEKLSDVLDAVKGK